MCLSHSVFDPFCGPGWCWWSAQRVAHCLYANWTTWLLYAFGHIWRHRRLWGYSPSEVSSGVDSGVALGSCCWRCSLRVSLLRLFSPSYFALWVAWMWCTTKAMERTTSLQRRTRRHTITTITSNNRWDTQQTFYWRVWTLFFFLRFFFLSLSPPKAVRKT